MTRPSRPQRKLSRLGALKSCLGPKFWPYSNSNVLTLTSIALKLISNALKPTSGSKS
jgi:hypothetical protein